MLIYNLCREIKQIFVIFFASPEFSAETEVDEEQKLQQSQPWQIIRQIANDFSAEKENEMAPSNIPSSQQPNPAAITVVVQEEKHMIFPRDTNGQYSDFKLKIRATSKTHSPNSSGNEQFSESQQSSNEHQPIHASPHSGSYAVRQVTFTS